MTQQRPSSHEPSALVQRGSPQLVTPPGTPDTSNFNESKLHQLLANFDSGTHSFCREERETAEERRKSFSSESEFSAEAPHYSRWYCVGDKAELPPQLG